MEGKSDEEPYRDPRALKTLATFTENEIHGKVCQNFRKVNISVHSYLHWALGLIVGLPRLNF